MFLFGSVLSGILCASWTWVSVSFPRLREVFSYYVFKCIFCPFLFSFWDSYNVNISMLDFVLLLLLLLSRFSHVRLCATPWTEAHQIPSSLGFSRQEHWSGLTFPSPMHASEKWKWSAELCPTLSNPMDCSLPGSSVHGIFQARVLEWVAIAFSKSIRVLIKKIT